MSNNQFTLSNTHTGDIKWTRTWGPRKGQRRTVPVLITDAGTLVDGKTIHIHGTIQPTGENIVIYRYGADSRFWGRCYHTKKEADTFGW